MEKNEKENKEEKKVENTNNNNKKYIIPILIIVIVILIGGICYLYMNSINKQKIIADKENTIKKQKEELLNISKDKENEKKLKLTIIFLRDKENKVTNRVYAAYVGIK